MKAWWKGHCRCLCLGISWLCFVGLRWICCLHQCRLGPQRQQQLQWLLLILILRLQLLLLQLTLSVTSIAEDCDSVGHPGLWVVKLQLKQQMCEYRISNGGRWMEIHSCIFCATSVGPVVSVFPHFSCRPFWCRTLSLIPWCLTVAEHYPTVKDLW